MSAKSFFSKGIEFTCLHIGFELTIPYLRIKCRIPSAKSGKFIGRQLLNLLLNCFDFAHIPPSLLHTG